MFPGLVKPCCASFVFTYASFAMATTSIACCKGHQIDDFKSACKEGAAEAQSACMFFRRRRVSLAEARGPFAVKISDFKTMQGRSL